MIVATESLVNEVEYEYAIKLCLLHDKSKTYWVEMTSYTSIESIIDELRDNEFSQYVINESNFWDSVKIIGFQGFEKFDVKNWSIEKLVKLIDLIESGVDAEAFSYFETQHHSTDLDDVYSSYQDAFIGIFKNTKEIVEYYLEIWHPEIEKIKLLDSSISSFLDYDSIYTALDNSGDYNIENNSHNQLMVFNSRW